jgi:hypothetical protein
MLAVRRVAVGVKHHARREGDVGRRRRGQLQ